MGSDETVTVEENCATRQDLAPEKVKGVVESTSEIYFAKKKKKKDYAWSEAKVQILVME